MKKEEVIRLAKEAGAWGNHSENAVPYYLTQFAKLVEQATLERAAKVCEHCVAISGASLASANEYRDEDAAIEISCERAAYADSAKRIRALKDSND